MTLLARKAAGLVAQALVVAALGVCERGKLHTAVMLLADARNVLDEGDDVSGAISRTARRRGAVGG